MDKELRRMDHDGHVFKRGASMMCISDPICCLPLQAAHSTTTTGSTLSPPVFSLASVLPIMSLLQKVNSNSQVIASKLASLQSHVQSCKQQVDQKVLTEKQQLEQENESLKQEIASLVSAINKLEVDSGPRAEVFRSKAPASNPAQVTPVPKAAPAVAPVKPAEPVKPVEPKPKAEAKPAAGKAAATGAAAGDRAVDVSRLDFRVGRIVSAKKHPDADGLYVEDVDVGEGRTRTVVSGLVKYVPLDQMQDRLVLLLCNLKPAKMRGVTSEAMVMCASTPEKVEILVPPPGAGIGDRAVVDGFAGESDPQLNPKKKIFEECAPFLKTNGQGIACYKDVPIAIPGKGPFTSTLTNVQVK